MKKWALDDRAQLHKDVNGSLDKNLSKGETVRVIIRGAFDSAIIGTDQRVFVFKKGFMAGALLGNKLASWDYLNVSGIHVESGPMTGVVAIQAPGGDVADVSTWSFGKGDPYKSPNAIVVRQEHYEQAREGVALLRQLIADWQRARRPDPLQGHDIPEQIKKLAELRDAGVLTTEEFETKKRQLLARL